MSKEPVGSVGEEAAKLFALLQQAAGDASGRESAGPREDRPEPEPAPKTESEQHQHATAQGGSDCQWCPVCQVISRVRNTSPETVEQLATAAASVLGSVRSLVEAAAESARLARADAAARAASAEPPTAGTAPRQDDARPARPGVDRIDVSEDPEPWD